MEISKGHRAERVKCRFHQSGRRRIEWTARSSGLLQIMARRMNGHVVLEAPHLVDIHPAGDAHVRPGGLFVGQLHLALIGQQLATAAARASIRRSQDAEMVIRRRWAAGDVP